MKSFIQRRAGVSFFQNEVVSIGIRSKYVESVFKISGGWYGVVNVVPSPGGITLFSVWGDALDILHKTLHRIRFKKDQCPLLRGILTGGNNDALILSMNSP